MRGREIYDRKFKRPILDTNAAARFIRHGLNETKPDKEILKPKKRINTYN